MLSVHIHWFWRCIRKWQQLIPEVITVYNWRIIHKFQKNGILPEFRQAGWDRDPHADAYPGLSLPKVFQLNPTTGGLRGKPLPLYYVGACMTTISTFTFAKKVEAPLKLEKKVLDLAWRWPAFFLSRRLSRGCWVIRRQKKRKGKKSGRKKPSSLSSRNSRRLVRGESLFKYFRFNIKCTDYINFWQIRWTSRVRKGNHHQWSYSYWLCDHSTKPWWTPAGILYAGSPTKQYLLDVCANDIAFLACMLECCM